MPPVCRNFRNCFISRLMEFPLEEKRIESAIRVENLYFFSTLSPLHTLMLGGFQPIWLNILEKNFCPSWERFKRRPKIYVTKANYVPHRGFGRFFLFFLSFLLFSLFSCFFSSFSQIVQRTTRCYSTSFLSTVENSRAVLKFNIFWYVNTIF